MNKFAMHGYNKGKYNNRYRGLVIKKLLFLWVKLYLKWYKAL